MALSKSIPELLQMYRNFCRFQITMLTFVGLWAIESKSSKFQQNLYFLYKNFILGIMYIFAISIFADIYLNLDDLSVISDGGCIFAGIVVIIFKTMNFQFRNEQMERFKENLFETTDDFCQFSMSQNIPAEKIKIIVRNNLLHSKVVLYGFAVLGYCLITALLFFSPFVNGLPIRAKYPFNTTISPWQEIAFLVEACAVSSGMTAILFMDTLTMQSLYIIVMQFNILNLNYENCAKMANESLRSTEVNYDQRKTKTDFINQYKTCLRFHQRVAFLVDDINLIFGWSMFVQMLSSTSMICLTGYQAVAVGGHKSNVLKFGIYLGTATFQLLYICWMGNELTNSSSMLHSSQWLSNWNNESLPCIAKFLTVSQTFSKKPHYINAGPFYVLSLQNFLAIMKGSYSFFAVLNNLS